jgi:hypothetical protein
MSANACVLIIETDNLKAKVKEEKRFFDRADLNEFSIQ